MNLIIRKDGRVSTVLIINVQIILVFI